MFNLCIGCLFNSNSIGVKSYRLGGAMAPPAPPVNPPLSIRIAFVASSYARIPVTLNCICFSAEVSLTINEACHAYYFLQPQLHFQILCRFSFHESLRYNRTLRNVFSANRMRMQSCLEHFV